MIKLILSLCLIIHSHAIQGMPTEELKPPPRRPRTTAPTATKLTELQTSLQTLQTKLTDLSGYLTVLHLRIQNHPLVEYFANDVALMIQHRSFIDFICSLEATWDVDFEREKSKLQLILKKNLSCVVYFAKEYTFYEKKCKNEHAVTYSDNAQINSRNCPDITYFEPAACSNDTGILLTFEPGGNLTLQDGLKLMQHIANKAPTATPQECFYDTHQKHKSPEILRTFIQSLIIDQNWTPSFKEKNNSIGFLSTLFLKKDNFCIVLKDDSSIRSSYRCSIAFNTLTEETPLKTWNFTKKPSTPEDDFTLEEIENEKTTATTFDAIHIFINQELAKGF